MKNNNMLNQFPILFYLIQLKNNKNNNNVGEPN